MSELLPNKVRGLGGSLGAMTNWIFATTITLGFIHYAKAVTPTYAVGIFCSGHACEYRLRVSVPARDKGALAGGNTGELRTWTDFRC